MSTNISVNVQQWVHKLMDKHNLFVLRWVLLDLNGCRSLIHYCSKEGGVEGLKERIDKLEERQITNLVNSIFKKLHTKKVINWLLTDLDKCHLLIHTFFKRENENGSSLTSMAERLVLEYTTNNKEGTPVAIQEGTLMAEPPPSLSIDLVTPILLLLAFLERHDVAKRGSLATLFDVRDGLINGSGVHDANYITHLFQSVRSKCKFKSSTAFLRQTIRKTKTAIKKRKLDEYLETLEVLCALERMSGTKEIMGFIGSYLTPTDLSSLSLTSKFIRDTVHKYIAGIVEYSCTSRPLIRKQFDDGVSVDVFCNEDRCEAWMLQNTQNLKKLTMINCNYTSLLQYCMRNLTQLQMLDVSHSDISNTIAKKLVEGCKNLTKVRCLTTNTSLSVKQRHDVAEEFAKSTVLIKLDVDYLRFVGEAPLPSVKELFLHGGNIGTCQRLSKLEKIVIYNNQVFQTLRRLTLAWKYDKTVLHNLKKIVLFASSLPESDYEVSEFTRHYLVEFREMMKNLSVTIVLKKDMLGVYTRLIRVLRNEHNVFLHLFLKFH